MTRLGEPRRDEMGGDSMSSVPRKLQWVWLGGTLRPRVQSRYPDKCLRKTGRWAFGELEWREKNTNNAPNRIT